jgi:hypothetical protein
VRVIYLILIILKLANHFETIQFRRDLLFCTY